MIKKFIQKGFLYDTLNKIIDKINNQQNIEYKAKIENNKFIPLNFNIENFKTLDDLPNTIYCYIGNQSTVFNKFIMHVGDEYQLIYACTIGNLYAIIHFLDWEGNIFIETNLDYTYNYYIKDNYHNDEIYSYVAENGNRTDSYEHIYDSNNNEVYQVESETTYYGYKPLVNIAIDDNTTTLDKSRTFIDQGYGTLYDTDTVIDESEIPSHEIDVHQLVGDIINDDTTANLYTHINT